MIAALVIPARCSASARLLPPVTALYLLVDLRFLNSKGGQVHRVSNSQMPAAIPAQTLSDELDAVQRGTSCAASGRGACCLVPSSR